MSVKVYTKEDCPACVRTKQLLDQRHIVYTEEEGTQHREYFASLGLRGFPVVCAPDITWSGFRPDLISNL